jgi:hypothetical protein
MAVQIRGGDIVFNNGTTQNSAAVVSTATVLAATAGGAFNAVGTYRIVGGNYAAGSNFAGSTLGFGGGTWKSMGAFVVSSASNQDPYNPGIIYTYATLFLRVS